MHQFLSLCLEKIQMIYEHKFITQSNITCTSLFKKIKKNDVLCLRKSLTINKGKATTKINLKNENV